MKSAAALGLRWMLLILAFLLTSHAGMVPVATIIPESGRFSAHLFAIGGVIISSICILGTHRYGGRPLSKWVLYPWLTINLLNLAILCLYVGAYLLGLIEETPYEL